VFNITVVSLTGQDTVELFCGNSFERLAAMNVQQAADAAVLAGSFR
jgi:hypothetical protein